MARKFTIPPSQRPDKFKVPVYHSTLSTDAASGAERLIQKVQELLASQAKQGQITLVAFVICGSWLRMIPLQDVVEQHGKGKVDEILQRAADEWNPDAILVACEAWSTNDPGYDATRSLEGQPGTFEVISLTYETAHIQRGWMGRLKPDRTVTAWEENRIEHTRFGNYFYQNN